MLRPKFVLGIRGWFISGGHVEVRCNQALVFCIPPSVVIYGEFVYRHIYIVCLCMN